MEQFDNSLVNESQKIGLIDAISHINVTEELIPKSKIYSAEQMI